MLSFEEARSRLLASARATGSERVALDEACGRVLAEAVLAPADAPRFDYSAMDGYAVSTGAWKDGPARLPVSGESRAGSVAGVLPTGSAFRIFTGAPIPLGADAVVMQEDVEREGDVAVFGERPKTGAHIRRKGEDLAVGALALSPGTRLRPSHVALAASCDRAWLTVARRPAVSLLSTGDELRLPGTTPRPGSIPESNSAALRAMAIRAGATVRVLPFVPDDPPSMVRAFEAAFLDADLLVTIGGVSVGDHDLVRPVLESIGAQIEFWRVAIKPGKPLVVGRHRDALVLGIPGNPTSAMVTFALFGVPLLRTMQGDSRALPTAVPARFSRNVRHQPGRLELVRVTVVRERDGLVVTPIDNQASGAVTSMASAHALACIEAERGDVRAGEATELLWLDELLA